MYKSLEATMLLDVTFEDFSLGVHSSQDHLFQPDTLHYLPKHSHCIPEKDLDVEFATGERCYSH